MISNLLVIQTDHFVNKIVTEAFAKGCNGTLINIKNYKKNSDLVATYGILRRTGEILKKSKNFWYIDHGYFKSSKRAFAGKTSISDLDGYFRVVHNDFVHSGNGFCQSDRLEKLNLGFKPLRKNGEYIILSEPSHYIKQFFGLENWVEKTINKLKLYTDRKIFVHNKTSEIKLKDLLKKAWAFVSEQSTAGFQAMIEGVPAHYTYKTMEGINSLQEIESGKINYKIFSNLAYGQWKLKEIASGEAWDFLKKDLL